MKLNRTGIIVRKEITPDNRKPSDIKDQHGCSSNRRSNECLGM
jgi:hypothetical protein